MNKCVTIYCLVTKHEWVNLHFAGHPNIGPFWLVGSNTTVENYTGTYLYLLPLPSHSHSYIFVQYNNIILIRTVQHIIRIVGARVIVINHFSTVGMTVQSDWYNTDGVPCILHYSAWAAYRREIYHIYECIIARPAFIYL